MPNIMALILLIGLSLVAALYALFTQKTLSAVIASGIISLSASIIFLIYGAPDVAMTEATIGAGLTTVVFLYAMKQTKGGDDD
ncbi:Na(+)/H(+) antiporter subunit B [Candidatus Cloacimonadaceae bacterium]